MQRYEFNDGKSSKFWQIEQQGPELHIAWGKIGTNGQSQVKTFDSDAKAQAAKDKLIQEKTGKGYAAAGEAPLAAGASLKVAKAADSVVVSAPDHSSPSGESVIPKKKAAQLPASPASDAQAAGAAMAGAAAADAAAVSVPIPAPESHASHAPDAQTADATQAQPLGDWLSADAPSLNAHLAARRTQPSMDEQALRAWPLVLQALANGEYDNTTAKAFTPNKAKRRFELGEGAWQIVKTWFEDAHLGSDWGYTATLRLSANVLADAAKALERHNADQQAADLARVHTQYASAWADVHGGEPQAAAEGRFGQALIHRLHRLPTRDDPGEAPKRMAHADAWQAMRKSQLFSFDVAGSAPDYATGIERLNARRASDDAGPPEPESDQMLMNTAAHMHNNHGMQVDPADVAAYLVDAYGLPEVVRMLGRSLQAAAVFDYSAGRSWVLVRTAQKTEERTQYHPYKGIWFRLRMHLVHADEALWQACVAAALDTLPEVPEHLHGLFGPLFMESPEVIAAALASVPTSGAPSAQSRWLLSCTTEPEMLSRLARAKASDADDLFDMPAALDDMLMRFGMAALPALSLGALNDATAQRLMALNHPLAMTPLVRVASVGKPAQARLKLALARWPLAGLIALARACAGAGKDHALLLPMLRDTLRELGPLASLTQAWLEPSAWAVLVQQAALQTGPQDVADAADLPPALAQPAWLSPKTRAAVAKPLQLQPLELPVEELWRPGELLEMRQALGHRWRDPAQNVNAKRASDLAEDVAYHRRNAKIQYVIDCAKAIEAGDAETLVSTWLAAHRRARASDQNFHGWLHATHIVALPEPLGLAFWNGVAGEVNTHDVEAAVVQWGAAAMPGLLRVLQANPAEMMGLMRHFGAVPIALHAARGAFKLKATRQDSVRWLLRWPRHAAAGLIAPALGKPGEPKDMACKALRLLAANGHAQTLLDVAAQYPQAEVTAGVQALLDENPLDLYPSKIGPLPEFWAPEGWARPQLTGGKVLGNEALAALGQMLSFSRVEGLYAGIDQVKAACTPESLADFSWDLFAGWLAAGAVAKDNWGFTSLGLFGNDAVARKLTPMIRAWPGEAAHARAVLGLDVLEAIGTDTALMLLNGIAQKLKFKGLQDKAQEKIEAIAQARGLSTQELEDRLAPDLGLDEQGSLVLDFGPRQFKVGFDEALKPWVRDFTGGVAGARLKDLPKPNKADDADLAQAATERYKALKKDAKTIAAQQIQRLDAAMCQQRRWSEGNFQMFIAQHPLVRHIAQRLVWGVYLVEKEKTSGESAIPDDEVQGIDDSFPSHGGELLACFRLTEDGSLSTADDDAFAMPQSPDAEHAIRIGVPHALYMSTHDQQAFGQLFADYELLQPFSQIGRDTYSLTEAEQAATELTRWQNMVVPTGKVMGLTGKGWERGAAQDGGWIGWMECSLADGRCINLDLDPGMVVGDINWEPEQKLGVLTLGKIGRWDNSGDMPWGQLDAVSASELIRTMESLR